MKKIALLPALLIIALLSLLGCTPEISPAEYDKVKNELSTLQDQLVSLQGKLAESETLKAQHEELARQYETAKSQYEKAQTEYEALSTRYEELGAERDTQKSAFEAVQAEYETLSTRYDELEAQYETLSQQGEVVIAEPAEITVADVEQALFKSVNQVRTDNGLNELAWSDLLHKWAIANSRNMATNARYEYSDYAGWQDVYWAVGYDTTDEIADAALTVWKTSLQYETNILNTVAKYGTVAVHKSGKIYYITYIASPLKG